ncbi:hypothetical protein NDU88_010909 [Pleurodeles waltl]|uniref:Uncharacterized protein n=1 Tax=Pleurodeles waltl TaxID=8319 RepID=A0AAV7S385_PLEWA|nr:hypothetical protein NDU88_010909 [Pleurodeles waltl]
MQGPGRRRERAGNILSKPMRPEESSQPTSSPCRQCQAGAGAAGRNINGRGMLSSAEMLPASREERNETSRLLRFTARIFKKQTHRLPPEQLLEPYVW